MSQNRQSLKDRARAETDFKVNLKNEVNIETMLRETRRVPRRAKAGAARESAKRPLATGAVAARTTRAR